MSLSQAVIDYAAAYEGHSSYEGTAFVKLRNLLRKTTLSEIITENNALTEQRLWSEPMMDLFYDELLYRLLTETTFALTTSWESLDSYLNDPFVVAWVGFEESYPMVDPNGSLIGVEDDRYNTFTLMNASFTTPMQELIIKMLLSESITAVVYLYPDTNSLEIGRLINANRPDEQIKLRPIQQDNYREVRVPLRIQEVPDWSRINQIYQGLRKQTPVVSDPYADVLINQLINLPEAIDIIEDGGITFEGDLLLSVEPDPEEAELVRAEY